MPRKSPGRIVRAVADAMWARDQLQMRAIDKSLSVWRRHDAGVSEREASVGPRGRRKQMPSSKSSRQWTGFRSVLCPIDFSEQSRLALRYAEAVAFRAGATLTVLYANDPLLITAAGIVLRDRQLAKRSANELQGFIAATTESKGRLRVKLRVSIGSPTEEILKAASSDRADLIVLGTHGLTGAGRLVMGSTTLGILQRTAVPVLAVPRADTGAAVAPSPSWPGERVIAALELNAAAETEVDIAARVAQWFGSSLLLLHVVSDITAPAWFTGDLGAHDRIRVARAQQQMDALAANARSRVKTECRVIGGRVADEIAALAATERAGLLISALRDRRGWFGARRGSVSYHVLSYAVTPVLAYPSQWRPR